jgi:signal transduction histidine kinase
MTTPTTTIKPTRRIKPMKQTEIPRLRGQDEARIERMIRENLLQDLVVQAVLLVVGLFWFSNRWIWATWGVRWVVLVAISAALVSIRSGRQNRALLLLASGHVVGVIGLVAIVPVLTPLAMLILAGDLFLGSYLQGDVRRRFFFVMVPVIAGVAALSFQSWTDLAERTPRVVAIVLIVAHTFGSGFLVPKSHRQHYVQLRLARDRLTASEQRLSDAVLAERASIASALEAEPVAGINLLMAKLQRIRENLAPQPQVAANIADAAASETQDALRSLRRISHGVYPELLQSGLHEALRQLVSGFGEVERFDVPQTRFPTDVETAVYMAVRELVVRESCVVNRDKNSRHSLVVESAGGYLHVFARFGGVRIEPGALPSSMPTDRIIAVSGEASLRVEGDALVFLASVPLEARLANPHTTTADANHAILSVFTTWASRATLVGMAVSALVMMATREVSGGLVVLAFAMLAAGSFIGSWYLKRERYGEAIASLCIASLTAAVFATSLVLELAPMMALIVSLPTTFALPFLSERRLDLIAALQGASLSALTVIAYLSKPLIERVVSNTVPAIAVPIGAGAVAALIAVTLTATVRTVTDASAQAVSVLAKTVHAADAQRQSIERDLHDGAQQLFVAVSLQFRALAKLVGTDADRASNTIATTESLLGQARVGLINVARGALVPELDEGRLADALRRGIGLLGLSNHEVKLTIRGVESVNPEVAAAVYFCCHEALQNATKHGGRDVAVELSVVGDGSFVRFSVADNGVGFDGDVAGGGHGLSSLAERIGALHGELLVVSVPGEGTVVSGVVPL